MVEGGAVSPLLGVFLGVVGALLLLAAAAIFITRRHCSRSPGRTPDLVAGQGESRWCGGVVRGVQVVCLFQEVTKVSPDNVLR